MYKASSFSLCLLIYEVGIRHNIKGLLQTLTDNRLCGMRILLRVGHLLHIIGVNPTSLKIKINKMEIMDIFFYISMRTSGRYDAFKYFYLTFI